MLACGVHLFVLAILLRQKSPLRWPVVLLCLVLFTWNFAELADATMGGARFQWLDLAVSPLTVPLALHVVLAFVGRVRERRLVLVATYLGFGLLSGVSCLPRRGPTPSTFGDSAAWSVLYLGLSVPAIVFAALELRGHLRSTGDASERIRTRLLLVALVLGGLLMSTALWPFGWAPPHVDQLGALLIAVVLALVVLRSKVLGHDVSASAWTYGGVLACGAAVAYAMTFYAFAGGLALGLFVAFVVTVTALALFRDLLQTLWTHRAREAELRWRGRMSAQLAHDLRNPLCALRGGLEYLQEENRRTEAHGEQERFLALLLEQTGRIDRILELYQRLTRIEPVFRPLPVRELLSEAVGTAKLRALASNHEVTITTNLAEELPTLQADAELLGLAFENVLRNAVEVSPPRGQIGVVGRVAHGAPRAEPSRLVMEVSDQGPGVDPRDRERIFDEFFTTKPEGTGLGLPFARQVARAHGGDLELASQAGGGTCVRLWLPVRE